MIVMVNFEKQIREAFIAGAAAAILHDRHPTFPKPDADEYLKSLQKAQPTPKF
jgi:hypothetical protein